MLDLWTALDAAVLEFLEDARAACSYLSHIRSDQAHLDDHIYELMNKQEILFSK